MIDWNMHFYWMGFGGGAICGASIVLLYVSVAMFFILRQSKRK